MLLATDSAWKSPARWVWIWVGVGVCITDVGCSHLRPNRQGTPPMLGSAAPFGPGVDGGGRNGDYYTQEIGKGVEGSRSLLAQERARAGKKGRKSSSADRGTIVRSTEHPASPEGTPSRGPDAPLDVALQAPETISAPRASSPPPATGEQVASADPPPAAGPQAASTEPPPLADAAPEAPAETSLESIVTASRSRLDALKNYQVAMKRQERVGDSLQPVEEAVLSIRRQPKAVRIEWPSGAHKGREVIFATGEGDGLLHVNMADSVVPVPPLALAPDSPLALSNSRHPITEAGFDHILENIEMTLKPPAPGAPSRGKLTYGGVEKPDGLERPGHKLIRVTPTGETWVVYIDTETNLPAMVQANDAKGELLERYVFGTAKVDLPELASAEAFDHGRRWGQPKGLLQRLARVGGAKEGEGADNATR